MKKIILVTLLIIMAGLNIVAGSDAPTINDLKISPELDISYFGRYTVEANITNADTVKIKVTAINGESGNDCWDYYIDGVCASESLEFDMTWLSGNTWKKEYIYPDNIYPEVFFTTSDTTWYNTPSSMLLHRHNYQLFHFVNPFQMDTNMSVWIEFNAVPRNYSTSAPIDIYVIGKGETTSYFQSEWRTKSNSYYAGSILRTDSFNHNHTTNSSHFLIPLKTDTNGKVGGLDVSDDFWIILYNDAEPIQRGWNLKYHNENLYTTQAWYTANRYPSSNWSAPSVQVGSPDVHVHIARRVNIIDGVKIDINATNTSGTTSDSYEFFFTPLPNLPPSKTIFTSPNPELGAYSGQILIEWLPATDANNDPLTYKLVLIRDGTETTLVENTTLTSFSWDSTTVPDGEYDLSLSICDPEICVITKLSDQHVGGFIVANNKPPNAPTIFSIGGTDTNSSYIYDEDNGLSYLFTIKGKDNGDPNGDEVQTVWLVSQTFENLWTSPDYNQTWQSAYANFLITDDLRGNGEKDWYFGLLVRDPLGETNSTWWKMTARDNPPVTFNGALVVIEDTPKSGKLNASDIDGDSLTFSIVTNPAHGGITDLNTSSGNFTYTPTSGYFGGDSFTFKVNDGAVDSNVSTVSITVTNLNNPPVTFNGALVVIEDTPKSGKLNASDIDGDSLTFSIVTNPAHGGITDLNTSSGNFTYTPTSGYFGGDSFTFKVNDGAVDSNVSTVSITVTNLNNPPVTFNGALVVIEDTPKSGKLNASDIDGDSLTFSIVTNPAHGGITDLNTSSGNFTYTPTSGYFGGDSFTFKVNDGAVDSNVSTVSITVTNLNNPPVTFNGALVVIEDTPKSGKLNASDIDGDSLTFSIVTNPAHGGITDLNTSSGNFTYTPTSGYFGGDSFTFKVNDGAVDSNVSTVSITVTNLNNPPVTFNGALVVIEDTPKSGKLNASDIDGDSLTFSIVTNPAHGGITDLNTSSGNFTYTPTSGYFGGDSFTFKVNDGAVDSNVSTVSITVTNLNNPPVTFNGALVVIEDTPKSGKLNASDIDGDSLTFSIVTNPAHGGITDLNTSSGNFTYTPTSGYFGGDSFTFKVNDGAVDSNVSTVSITVNAENDAPTASNDAYSTYENTPLVVVVPGVLGNDFDVEGDILSAILVDDVDYGTLILNANGSFTYTPNSDFQGTDSFAYKANDGLLDSNIATVTITVENLPPSIKRGVTLPENILFSNVELMRLVIHTESISIDDTIGEASDIAETIVVDGIEVYVIELSEGKNTIQAQVYNPGFLTQIDVNIRFENLPQGVSIEIDGQSQKIRAHRTGNFMLTINVSPEIPKGEYFITAISSTRNGSKDQAIIKIIIN